jgi:hypothetical protein
MNIFVKLWIFRLSLFIVIHIVVFALYRQVVDEYYIKPDTVQRLTSSGDDRNIADELRVQDYELRLLSGAFSQMYDTPLHVEQRVIMAQYKRRDAAKPFRILLNMHPVALGIQLDERIVHNVRRLQHSVVHYRSGTGQYDALLSAYAINSLRSIQAIRSHMRELHRRCADGGAVCVRFISKSKAGGMCQTILTEAQKAGFSTRHVTVRLLPLMLTDMSFMPQLALQWGLNKRVDVHCASYCSTVIIAKKSCQIAKRL